MLGKWAVTMIGNGGIWLMVISIGGIWLMVISNGEIWLMVISNGGSRYECR
jgi:hypothetical protein